MGPFLNWSTGNKKGYFMELNKIKYADLNAKAKETYNFQKVSAKLVDYGFSTNWLNVDFESADFIAVHFNGLDILKVQLKGRISIYQKYLGKDIYMTWPDKKSNSFYLIPHAKLIEIIGETTNWLETPSWLEEGGYSAGGPSKKTELALAPYLL